MDCHNDKTLFKTNAGVAVSLFVELGRYTNSVHRTNACRSCHADISSKHPDDEVAAKPVNCALCHTNAGAVYQTSIHGVSLKMGASAAATCKDCHGHHDIMPVKQPDSPVFKMNLPQTCARCHTNANVTAEYKMKYPQVGGAVPGQHPRPGPAQDGPDRGADLQRLPRRARHQAQRGSQLAHQPRQRGQDLRQVPRQRREDLQRERARPAAGQGRGPGTGLHRLPQRPRDRAAGQRPLQDGQRPALRQVPRGPARRTTARPTTARPWPWASPTSPRTWPPATTATATTTCCRRPTPSPGSRRATSSATCQQCHPNANAELRPATCPTPIRSTGRTTRSSTTSSCS